MIVKRQANNKMSLRFLSILGKEDDLKQSSRQSIVLQVEYLRFKSHYVAYYWSNFGTDSYGSVSIFCKASMSKCPLLFTEELKGYHPKVLLIG